MKPCPQCGTSVEPGETFCPSCGYFLDWSADETEEVAADSAMSRRPGEEVPEELPPPPPPVDTTPMVPPVMCATCGEANEPDRTFCRRCGTTLHAAPTPPPPQPPPPKPDRRPLIIGVLGALAAIVLIVVLVVALTGDDDATDPTVAPSTTSATTASSTAGPGSTVPGTTLPVEDPPLDTADVTAARVDTPPVLDGDLGEWQAITSTRFLTAHAFFGEDNWTGAADVSAEWKLAWDADYLYIAVETFDDVHVQGGGSRLWEGDSIDLEFDTDPGGDAEDGLVDLDDWQWILSPGNFTDVEPSFLLYRGRGDEAFQGTSLNADLLETAVVAKSPAGFVIEARIPWRRMFFEDPPAGAVLGFSLSVSDNDTPGTAAQETMISNHPDFRVAEPQTWGTLTLLP